MAQLSGATAYAKRDVPTPSADLPSWASTLRAWLSLEFGNVQRALTVGSARTVTMDTTIMGSDALILVDTTTQVVNVSWPSPLTRATNWTTTVKRISGGAHNGVVVGTVDGTTNPTLTSQYSALTMWCDGVHIWKLSTV